jgi:hypothetical protein
MNSDRLIKILFLASDPSDASRLRLGQELRDIQQRLQLAFIPRYSVFQVAGGTQVGAQQCCALTIICTEPCCNLL